MVATKENPAEIISGEAVQPGHGVFETVVTSAAKFQKAA
jgi:hypothetical protein